MKRFTFFGNKFYLLPGGRYFLFIKEGHVIRVLTVWQPMDERTDCKLVFLVCLTESSIVGDSNLDQSPRRLSYVW